MQQNRGLLWAYYLLCARNKFQALGLYTRCCSRCSPSRGGSSLAGCSELHLATTWCALRTAPPAGEHVLCCQVRYSGTSEVVLASVQHPPRWLRGLKVLIKLFTARPPVLGCAPLAFLFIGSPLSRTLALLSVLRQGSRLPNLPPARHQALHFCFQQECDATPYARVSCRWLVRLGRHISHK